MKIKYRRCVALLSAMLLIFSLFGCGDETSGYRVVDTLSETGFVMAFREGDRVAEYINAAVSVLAARGVVHELALTWLGEDNSSVSADAEALSALGEIPEREFILGFDKIAAPMAFEENGEYTGFDIELAEKACELLGWTLRLQPIDTADVTSELLSGNIDAAWGGLYSGASGEGISVTGIYMEVSFVLVTRAEDGLKTRRSLKGKYLSMGADEASEAALDGNVKLRDSLGSISRLAAGAEGCFKELDNGACDVVLVNSAAASYYMSRVSAAQG